MKKTKSLHSRSATKAKITPKNVDEYLAGIPEPARSILGKMRSVIRSAVPAGATESISYGMPAFRKDGMLVWYAAFANHCSLFPTAAVIEANQKALEGYATSKGTVRFPLDKPLPVALIRKLVKARVVQHKNKKPR